MNTALQEPTYNYRVVRQFAIMTLVWGVVGMGLGVFIAAQLVWPQLNLDLPWTSFGRLRPLHTNLVIFAFGGSALFATSYYTVQRTCQARLFGDGLAAFTFWGWQVLVVMLLVTLPQGLTTTKEYAEVEFTGAVWMGIVWVAYAVVFFGTVMKRRTRHIYVGNWFFGSFILVTAMLHVVNHMAIPVSWFKSYPLYSGATDAMVQWWYGHNAVGFFLTTGFLGMMYYFIPKRRAPGLLLPPVHRPLLGADHPVHLGRPAPPALHRAAGLGAEPGHGDVDHPPGAQLGRHDQRHDDPLRRLA